MVELLYAQNEDGQLVHINDVPNGIACRCHCPCCSAPLVAKNNGETMAPHFAHASGAQCSGAHESELHLLAKTIISQEKAVMLPRYANVYPGGIVRFDNVEVEKRDNISALQPDLCGIAHNRTTGKESRLWIEIKVTHAIGPEKREAIKKNGIACVEIDLSQFMNRQVLRDELQVFLLKDKKQREWTNNPLLEKRRTSSSVLKREYAEMKSEESKKMLGKTLSEYEMESYYANEQNTYLDEHKDCFILDSKACLTCKHHTTRHAIYEEAKRLHLPTWIKAPLSSNLLYWTHDNVKSTVEFNKCYVVHYDTYLRILPTSSPDVHGRAVSSREIKKNERIISFLLDTVPAIIASEGMKCQHNIRSFSTSSYKYRIACNMPNVVNKHRRKG